MNRLNFGLSLFYFICISQICHAQWWFTNWSEPQALTDSASDNTNPVLVNPYATDDLLMVYEKQENGSKKKLWMRMLSDPSSIEMPVFEQDIYYYSNPHLVHLDYYGGSCYLLFLSDKAGNFDIFCSELNEEGTFDEPVNLTESVDNEQELFVHNQIYYEQFPVCWNTEGSIYTATVKMEGGFPLLNNIYLHDTENCSNPVCSLRDFQIVLAYEKHVSQEDVQIWRRSGIYYTNIWNDPELISETGNNDNLMISNQWLTSYLSDFLIWSMGSEIYVYDPNYEQLLNGNIPGLLSFGNLSLYIIEELVDYTSSHLYIGLNGCNIEGTNNIYFSSAGMDFPVLFVEDTISSDVSSDARTYIFPGRYVSVQGIIHFELIFVWNEKIQDHSVIYWSSRLYDVFGNVNSKYAGNDKKNFDVIYNDVNQHLIIRYNNQVGESANLEMYNSSGNNIYSISLSNLNNSLNDIDLGCFPNLVPGLYFIRINSVNGSSSEKFLVAK